MFMITLTIKEPKGKKDLFSYIKFQFEKGTAFKMDKFFLKMF
jgi:hypothetical protein